ncbi:tail fiber/spike domain-containing protein [Enterobacter chuandaensis]|uniref:Tail spike TSP1/Gp66 N-terminal domain-containing protein n=1 Tax=Enterobacter chuandaensis TaxID=2497875 RepID=A0AA96RVT6_9ENTR|nr:hypothetical protein [Enterobacter chuandaensis]WNS40014.1 hypothetical protein RQP59_10830 [Enterobacter chuandaensis]
MATQPTNLPVPSESPRDLKFNAGKIDEFVTSENHVYVDRFGDEHRTIAGINYDANQAILNYGYITKDSFEDGSTISLANECLRWKSNGEYYRWDGTFPKVVPPASTPDSTGGIGQGKWVGVGDASLRSNLAEEAGVNLVGGSGVYVYIANGVDDSSGIANASATAVSKSACLKISGIAKVVTPTTISAQIAYTDKQIFTIDSKVTLNSGYALPDWFGDVENAVDVAINSLPASGGVIKLLNKRYKPSGYQYGFSGAGKGVTKDNITIIGSKQPSPNNTYDRLVNGTVIEGCFLVWANGFSMSDVGIDCGKYVVDTYYAGNPQPGIHEGFFATYLNDAEKNASNYKYGMRLHNVSGMAYSSVAMVHAMIVAEGYVNTRCTGLMHAMMGVHGAVFKARDCLVDNVISECAGGEGVIVKSDIQASARALNVPVKKITCYGAGTQGSSPHSVAPAGAWGVLFQNSGNPIDNVKLGNIDVFGYSNGIGFSGIEETVAVYVESFHYDGEGTSTSAAVRHVEASTQGKKIFFGYLHARNCEQVISAGNNNMQVSVSQMDIANVSDALADIQGNTVVVINSLKYSSVGSLWRLNGNAKAYLGTETHTGITAQEFAPGGLAPQMASGWSAPQQAFTAKLRNFGIVCNGLLRSSSGATSTVITLPASLRPAEIIRIPALTKDSSSSGPIMGTLTIGNDIIANEYGSVSASSDYISLSVNWSY